MVMSIKITSKRLSQRLSYRPMNIETYLMAKLMDEIFKDHLPRKKFTPRPRIPDLNALREIFPNEPWKAQMTQGKNALKLNGSMQS